MLCVSVEKHLAEAVLKRLRSRSLVDPDHLVTRSGDSILIPVKDALGVNEALKEVSFKLVECSPPSKQRMRVEKVPSYDLIGGVAIVRDNVLGYMGEAELIQVLRSIHPGLRAIYVKEETVDKYRTPVLRLLWGEPVEEVLVKEYGLSFKVSLGRAYYNPRLSEEHHRVASLVRDGEVVVDLFTGIGGFPVHIASLRTALVIANDLNPEAYRLLCENIALNHRRLKGTIIPLNLDAREVEGYVKVAGRADRVIANLPKWSVEFTDVYDALLRPGGVLHIYVLSYDAESSIMELEARLPGWIHMGSRLVLEYAPRAGIYRFDLAKPDHV